MRSSGLKSDDDCHDVVAATLAELWLSETRAPTPLPFPSMLDTESLWRLLSPFIALYRTRRPHWPPDDPRQFEGYRRQVLAVEVEYRLRSRQYARCAQRRTTRPRPRPSGCH